MLYIGQPMYDSYNKKPLLYVGMDEQHGMIFQYPDGSQISGSVAELNNMIHSLRVVETGEYYIEGALECFFGRLKDQAIPERVKLLDKIPELLKFGTLQVVE